MLDYWQKFTAFRSIKPKALTLFACIAIGLFLPVTASAQVAVNSPDIDDNVRERMDSLKIPGAALAIVHGDEIEYLAGYSLLIRLPNNDTSVLQVLRFEPDLGLLLMIILLLTLGWGSLRSLWAVRRWRAGLQHA